MRRRAWRETSATPSGVEADAFACDVTETEQVKRLVDDVMRRFGRIDILINDAAYNKAIPFRDLDALTIEEWSKIININLTGPMHCIKAVAPVMQKQGRGRIVNIASVAGLGPSGSSIAYAVSKAGLIHLTRCMAVALAPQCWSIASRRACWKARARPRISRRRRSSAVGRSRAAEEGGRQGRLADQVVTMCRTETMTGQTVVIDSGRYFH